jgi:hypothetical protein
MQVGVGDPYVVTFHLPNDCNNGFSWSEGKNGDIVVSINPEVGVCQELVTVIIKLLCQYLLDDSVLIVEMTSKFLRVSSSDGRYFCVSMVFLLYNSVLLLSHFLCFIAGMKGADKPSITVHFGHKTNLYVFLIFQKEVAIKHMHTVLDHVVIDANGFIY